MALVSIFHYSMKNHQQTTLCTLCILCVSFVLICGCNMRKKTDSFSKGQIDSLKLEYAQIASTGSNIHTIDMNSCLDASAFAMEDLIDTMYVIPLETTPNSYLDQISKIVIGDSYIYIMDNYMDRGISVFDKNGKFIRRLPRGKGHGELFRLYDMDYDYENRQLIAYQHSFLMFYTEDGRFIESKPLPLVCHDIAVTNKGYLLKCLDGQGNSHLGSLCDFTLFEMNKNFAIEQAYLPFESHDINYGLEHNLYNNHGNISIAHAFVDTIYEYANDAIHTKYHVDYSDKHFNESLLNGSWTNFENKVRNTDCFFFIGSYMSTNTHSFISIENWYQQNTCIAYYNKDTGKILGACGWMYDEKKLPRLSLPVGAYGDFFVSLHDYEGKENSIGQTNIISAKDLKAVKTMKEEDNPMLVLYKVKL